MRAMLYTALVVFAGAAVPATAQQPTTAFGIDINPVVTIGAGRVLTVVYDVRFHATAGAEFSSLMVRSPVPVQTISAPAALANNMILSTEEGVQAGAKWSWFDGSPQNGERRSGLAYSAVGLPGIVRYRLRRYVAPREALPGEIDDNAVPPTFDSPSPNETLGYTIGVVAWPTDSSLVGLLAWLRGQVAQARALGWIDNEEECQRLLGYLRGTPQGLLAFVAEAHAQRGKHINETAHSLFTSGAEVVAAPAH